jgi:hypothetical protein
VELHLNAALLNRRYQVELTVCFSPEDARKQLPQLGAFNRDTLVIPSAVSADAHIHVATIVRIPGVQRCRVSAID